MRPPPASRGGFRFTWTTTRTIIAANIAAFILQPLLVSLSGEKFVDWFLLSASSIKAGHLWTIATYSLFHAGLFHLLGNMIGLWCMGEFINKSEGRARMLTIYLGGILAGGVAWLILSFLARPGWDVPCLGASAGVFALFAYALIKLYNEPIRIFIYFILPVTLRSKWVLAGLLALTLGGLLLLEIPLTTGWWNVPRWLAGTVPIAHSAHLGGMLWGAAVFAWARLWLGRSQPMRRKLQPLRQTVFVRHTSGSSATQQGQGSGTDNITPFVQNDPGYLYSEADRILDKMNEKGRNALTAEELDILKQVGPLYRNKPDRRE